jgi:flavin reductase (DIM6/NTAB) family NADH-FMN oxidoreductase RutF
MAKQPVARKEAFCLPWTQTILGTLLRGRPSWMALDWVTRVNYQPALIGICVGRTHASHEAILATGEFGLSVPSADLLALTDAVGMVSARDADKADFFGEVFHGALAGAPMVAACPLTLECRVERQVDLPSNTFFIAEIVNLYAEPSALTDGMPDAAKIRPFLLTMPDNRYWALGEPIGQAWQAGQALADRARRG